MKQLTFGKVVDKVKTRPRSYKIQLSLGNIIEKNRRQIYRNSYNQNGLWRCKDIDTFDNIEPVIN